MEGKKTGKYYSETSHNTILFCYTLFSVILIGEALLLSWEKWALILIAAGVVLAWIVHIRQSIPSNYRIWLYAILMMATAFFYGSHTTSTFDLGIVMTGVVLIYMSTGVLGLITLCQITYYLAIIYDLFFLYNQGEVFDRLLITRTLLHLFIVTLFCLIARSYMRRQANLMGRTEESKQELAEMTGRLNDFLANISHEIRTPINAVIGLTRICIDRTDDREIKKDLTSVMEAGNKVADQISDILDYSEIDMGTLAVSEEDYMISSLLHDLVTEISPIRKKNLELIINVDPRLPSVLRTDVVKLKKILRHLLDNAIKYTNEGGVYLHLSFEQREYGINLLIEVRDTGIGMDQAQLEKAFEGLYQADSGRTRYSSGLGLGLAIIRGFVRSLNGFFVAQSEPNVGTTVRISIPQKVVNSEYCMSLRNPEKLCIGTCYKMSTIKHPLVKEFYDAYGQNLMLGLGVKIHRADRLDDLKEIDREVKLTHVFVGMQIYLEDREYIDAMSKRAMVAVICDWEFELPEGSEITLIRRPLYGFSYTTFINLNREERKAAEGKLYARGVRTLVVDDEYMNLTVANQILRGYGMVVNTALSGAEAVEYVRTNEVDLIFMDHMMAGMDGVEAMKRIRSVLGKEGKETVIVALTANTVSTANEMFLREGFDAFLAKPIVISELERVLKKVLPKSMLTLETKASGIKRSGTGISGEPEKAGEAKEPGEAVKPEEAEEQQKQADEQFSVLKELGIDTATGLGYCQGDEEFYKVLLLQFADEAEGKIREAGGHLQDNDLKNYEILVHAVKGTAKMIGAGHLSEEAYELEKAAHSGDGDTIRLSHGGVMEEYKRIADEIHGCFRKGSNETMPDDEAMEFYPDDGADDEVMEFYPDDGADNEVMKFYPDDGADNEVLEFYPEGSEYHE